MATATQAPPTASRPSVRVQVQKFGTFLSNMIMPNIGAIIGWEVSKDWAKQAIDNGNCYKVRKWGYPCRCSADPAEDQPK